MSPMSDGLAAATPSVSAGGDVGDVTKHALEILARAPVSYTHLTLPTSDLV